MLTGLLIAILIIASAATVVGGGLVLASQRKRLPEPDDPALLGTGSEGALERTISDVRVGDVLQYNTKDFLVEGVIQFDEDGHRWACARTSDGRDERWVMIGLERSGAGGAMMLAEDASVRLSGYPPETLVASGVRYAQKKRGTATARASGDVGSIGSAAKGAPESVLRCRWWTYDSAGDDCLVVEQWGDDFRALRGRRTVSGEIEMMPGS